MDQLERAAVDVGVELDGVFEVAGVAAAHQEHDGHAPAEAAVEKAVAALPEAFAGERESAWAVVPVRIATGLVEEELGPGAAPESLQLLLQTVQRGCIPSVRWQADVARPRDFDAGIVL